LNPLDTLFNYYYWRIQYSGNRFHIFLSILSHLMKMVTLMVF